jgi:hypothetical protein
MAQGDYLEKTVERKFRLVHRQRIIPETPLWWAYELSTCRGDGTKGTSKGRLCHCEFGGVKS